MSDWSLATEKEIEATVSIISGVKHRLSRLLVDRDPHRPLSKLHSRAIDAYERLESIQAVLRARREDRTLTEADTFVVREHCRQADYKLVKALHRTVGCGDNWCSAHEQCRSYCRKGGVHGSCVVLGSCGKNGSTPDGRKRT